MSVKRFNLEGLLPIGRKFYKYFTQRPRDLTVCGARLVVLPMVVPAAVPMKNAGNAA